MIKPLIDFHVLSKEDYYDPFTLSIADGSVWAMIAEKPSIIEITTPGSRTPVVNYFKKESINIFNSINLSINCPTCLDTELIEIPDGIYTIEVKGSPSTFSKKKRHLRTVKTRLEIAKQLIELNMGCGYDCNSAKIKELLCIGLLIDSAEANIMYDNVEAASDEFQLALKKLGKLGECRDCY